MLKVDKKYKNKWIDAFLILSSPDIFLNRGFGQSANICQYALLVIFINIFQSKDDMIVNYLGASSQGIHL